MGGEEVLEVFRNSVNRVLIGINIDPSMKNMQRKLRELSGRKYSLQSYIEMRKGQEKPLEGREKKHIARVKKVAELTRKSIQIMDEAIREVKEIIIFRKEVDNRVLNIQASKDRQTSTPHYNELLGMKKVWAGKNAKAAALAAVKTKKLKETKGLALLVPARIKMIDEALRRTKPGWWAGI